MRPADPRDNPGTVLAAFTFGLLVFLVPAEAAAPVVTAQIGTAPAAAAPAPAQPAALPVQKVVAVAARPVVLAQRAPDRLDDRTVTLTFDDGPDPHWTPKVLELLRRHRAVATFCVVGDQVRKYRSLTRDVVAAGMRLCDHTRTHPGDLTAIPLLQQRSEVIGARADIAAAADAPVAYFRAPGGHWSPEVLQLAAQSGMQPLGWSVDLRDWEQPGTPAILAALERHVRPGAVILMHDGGGDRQQTVEALEVLLPWLVDHGYRFTFPTP